MKEWYNGYRFSPFSSETVFNSTMCLYALSKILLRGKLPAKMTDRNLGQNIDKIDGILRLASPRLVKEILEKALNNVPLPFEEEGADLNLNLEKDVGEFEVLSILFYMGFLTYTEGGDTALCIPNRAVRIQFLEYFLKHIIQVKSEFVNSDFVKTLAPLSAGNPEPFFNFACNRYSDASGLHDHAHLNESNFQTLLVSNFILTDLYDIQSEYEVRGSDAKGYADILVTPKKGSAAKYSYLIEIKHLKVEEGKSVSLLQDTVDEAKRQLARYSLGNNVSDIENLKRIVAVFVGVELKVLEVY